MTAPGLCKFTGDPEAETRLDRMLRRLGNPNNVVTHDGITINGDGKLAVRPGAATTPYRAITAATTILATDYTIHATSGGPFTQPLPTAVGISGRVYVVRNDSGGIITLDPAAAELIDGTPTVGVANGAAARIQSTGAGWILV